MALRKSYSCDLCNSAITDNEGVGVVHRAMGEIQAVYLHNEGAGHHLCNRCVKGLRSMLADLDRTAEIHDELDAAERATS